MTRAARGRARYRTTLDRAGLSLATGAGACALAAALVGSGSGAGAATVAFGALIAGVAGAAVIILLAGPVWHLMRSRGPTAAGMTGAGVAGVVTLVVLSRSGGAVLPAGDGPALAAVWSVLATAAVAAFVGGLIGLAMWLVAYRA